MEARTPYVPPAQLEQIWALLENCHDRGIHVLDDDTGDLHYRSYANWLDEARRIVPVLYARGLRQGAAVLVSAETTPRFPALWLALMWLGCTPVTMPPVSALTGQYTFRERIGPLVGYFGHYLCGAHEMEEIQAIVDAGGHATVLVNLAEVHAQALQAEALPLPPRANPDWDDLAFIQFTSGSTKAPKGIRITWRNLMHNVAGISNRLEVDPHAGGFISWLPLYHDMGLVGKFLNCLLTQTRLVLLSPAAFARRPVQFLAMAAAHKVHYCSMPNFGYEWILKRLTSRQVAGIDLSHLKLLGVGAEPVNRRTLQAFAAELKPCGLQANVLSPCYGLAEATLAVTIARPGQGYALSSRDGETYVTCGQLLDGMEVRLGVGGRILIRGESVAQTALIDGVVTRIVDDEGYYDTKDVGYWHEQALVIQGRADEMFIVNGENVFPYDIESAVRGVPNVHKNRAVCFQCPATQERLSRIVVLYESLPQTAQQRERMEESIARAVLAHAGLPVQEIVAVPPRSIPVTPSGKLQRLRARQLYLAGFYRDGAGMVKTQELEEAS